ncbi:MAG: methionine biosynthesis protein MetW [Patescibacteria group bacterium]
MSVKNFENKRWSDNDQKLEFRHRATLEMIGFGKVLDLGCGDGLLLSMLKDKGIIGEGLDISEEGVSKARARGINASVFDFSNKLPFSDDTFDVVVMLDLLEHLYDPETLFKEAVRVSKQSLIVGIPNFSSLPSRLQVLFGKVPENNRPKKGHVYWFNYNVLKLMCLHSQVKFTDFRSNTFLESLPVISYLMKFFAKIMPNLFSLSFVVKITKY